MKKEEQNMPLKMREMSPERIKAKFNKILENEKNASENELAKQKKVFINKWINASTGIPRKVAIKQAEVLWELIVRLMEVEDISRSAEIHNMKF